MAKYFKMRKNPSFMQIIIGVVMLALYGLVGTQMLDAISNTFNCTESPFIDGYQMLGWQTQIGADSNVNCTAGSFTGISATDEVFTGRMESTGLIGVLFILAAAGVIITAFFKLNFK